MSVFQEPLAPNVANKSETQLSQRNDSASVIQEI